MRLYQYQRLKHVSEEFINLVDKLEYATNARDIPHLDDLKSLRNSVRDILRSLELIPIRDESNPMPNYKD